MAECPRSARRAAAILAASPAHARWQVAVAGRPTDRRRGAPASIAALETARTHRPEYCGPRASTAQSRSLDFPPPSAAEKSHGPAAQDRCHAAPAHKAEEPI